MSDIIRELEKEQLRTDLPKLEVGDTVRVFVKVVEGSRERLQNFEGVVIKIQGGGIRKSFTVRRVSYGVGVERTFPYNAMVKCAGPSCSTCGIAWARPPRWLSAS